MSQVWVALANDGMLRVFAFTCTECTATKCVYIYPWLFLCSRDRIRTATSISSEYQWHLCLMNLPKHRGQGISRNAALGRNNIGWNLTFWRTLSLRLCFPGGNQRLGLVHYISHQRYSLYRGKRSHCWLQLHRWATWHVGCSILGNSLTSGRYGSSLKSIIFKLIIQNTYSHLVQDQLYKMAWRVVMAFGKISNQQEAVECHIIWSSSLSSNLSRKPYVNIFIRFQDMCV